MYVFTIFRKLPAKQTYHSADKLISAIENLHTKHIKLGTLAIHAGLMTAAQVDAIVIRQTHEDKRFGELAIEKRI